MENITETPKTKNVKIGNGTFEIPAKMSISGMVECWKTDSEHYEELAKVIVKDCRNFATAIAHEWLEQTGYLLIPKDYRGFVGHTEDELRKMVKEYSKTKKADQS